MVGAKLAATGTGGLSTFLLEMALDEARLRERFAAALLDWRKRRGGGDAERFPQLEAARELGAGYRTYQHWEAADHLPRRWADVERILELIGATNSDLFAEDEPPAPIELEGASDDPSQEPLLAELAELRTAIARVEAGLARLADRLEPPSEAAGS